MVDRLEHGVELVLQGGVGVAVALAGQRDRDAPVTLRSERGHHVVPSGGVEPKPGDEQNVHDVCPFEFGCDRT